MADAASIISAFLDKADRYAREHPFCPFPPAHEPLDLGGVSELIFVCWLARSGAFVNSAAAAAIRGLESPLQTLKLLRTLFPNEVPGRAIHEEYVDFTIHYYTPRTCYPSDLFSLYPQEHMPTLDTMWARRETVWELIDARLQSWRAGNMPQQVKQTPCRTPGETLSSAVPMTCAEWVSRLGPLSDAVTDHDSSVAYADHFHAPLSEAPTEAAVLAAFAEFLRCPPHDASLLCPVENFLGTVPFSTYVQGYATSICRLLDLAPQYALDLLDYPGCELEGAQIEQLISTIRLQNPGRDVVAELAGLAVKWECDDDEPYARLVAAAYPSR